MVNIDSDSVWDRPVFDSKVTGVVSGYDFISDLFPFFESVKILIEVAVETKCLFSDLTRQLKIVESLFESWEFD